VGQAGLPSVHQVSSQALVVDFCCVV